MQRRFKVSISGTRDEVLSEVFVRDTDDRADAAHQLRRRARGTPLAMIIFPAAPLPAGLPHDRTRHRALIDWWAADAAGGNPRRARYTNERLPEAVNLLPEGALQSGLHQRIVLLRAAELDGWTLTRMRAVHDNVNDILLSYPWSEWGSPVEPMMDEIQRHMLEPVINHGVTWFDGLWTLPEISNYFHNRVNDFLTQTGAKTTCPAFQPWTATALRAVLEDPALPLTSADQWTPAQRAMYWERRAVAQKWLDARESEIKALLTTDPNSVPGWRLGKPKTRETVKDPQEVFRRFSDRLRGSTDVFMAAVTVGNGKLKDAVRLVTGLKGRELDGTVNDLLDGCVRQPPSNPALRRLRSDHET